MGDEIIEIIGGPLNGYSITVLVVLCLLVLWIVTVGVAEIYYQLVEKKQMREWNEETQRCLLS